MQQAVEEAAARVRAARRDRPKPSPEEEAREAGRRAWRLHVDMSNSGIPARYQEAVWQKVRYPQIRSYADGWASNWEHGRGLMIFGSVGTGKSSVAALIAKEVLAGGFTARWEYVPTMVDEIGDRQSRMAAYRRQVTPSLLVWDDWGVTNLAEWQIGLLDRIVERRYSRKMPMVVTTNLTGADLRADEALQRMVDRWNQVMTGWTIDGKSQRTPA